MSLRFKGLGNMRCALLLGFVTMLGVAHAQIVASADFENYSDNHQYTRSNLSSDGLNPASGKGFNDGRAYIDEDMPRSSNGSTKALKITYPANNYGTNGTGVNAPLRFAERSEVFATYKVRFDENFDWGGTSEGGKLPGLGSGDNCSGCTVCTGSNGLSARLMWRTAGRGVLYLYHMDKPGTCGDDLQLNNPDGTSFFFQKGVWYKISERVKVNTGSSSNGEVEVWINDQQALLKTGLKFVTNGAKIDNFYFSTFHGGGSNSWAPSRTSYIWFDDLKIGRSKSDVVNATPAPNAKPNGSFVLPTSSTVVDTYEELIVKVAPTDSDGSIASVALRVNGKSLSTLTSEPYEWGRLGSSTANQTAGLQSGTYNFEATITDNDGATRLISKRITVSPYSGLYDETGGVISLFPNPSANGVFNLSKKTSWKVYSILGETLISGTNDRVDLSRYGKGLYVLRIGQSSQKIMVD